MWDDTRMTSVHPDQRPHRSGWPATLRRRAGLLLVAAVLLGTVVVAVAMGWVGWLVGHPGQAWAWIQRRWLASSALAVVVAALGVWVAWAAPRRQHHHTERLAASEHNWQERREQERHARERARAAAEQEADWAQRCRSLLICWPLPAPHRPSDRPLHAGL
jgi:ABC-type nickel/cobalt efflux system permease component RcnA